LTQVLRHLVPFQDPAELDDPTTTDDAAVYRIDADRAMVATVDFFTPIVDDPYDFGRIAATNALSDIYAMGARPLFALNIVAFPRDLLDQGVLSEIIRGGGEVARRAGVAVIGGHSIDDAEPKFGMAVIGEVAPEGLVRNSTAQVGDKLVLTKPVGTGIIATAIKMDKVEQTVVQAAVASMTTLNRGAAEAMLHAGATAATDVTGYGLLGHLHEIARASRLGARISAEAVPLLAGARELAEAGFIPGGTRRNKSDLGDNVHWAAEVDEPHRMLLCDAQTSGGLLIAIPQERLELLLSSLQEAATPAAAVIGELIPGEGGLIVVER
jgi:selenide,water dikinase